MANKPGRKPIGNKVIFALDPSDKAKLEAWAQANHTTQSELMRQLIHDLVNTDRSPIVKRAMIERLCRDELVAIAPKITTIATTIAAQHDQTEQIRILEETFDTLPLMVQILGQPARITVHVHHTDTPATTIGLSITTRAVIHNIPEEVTVFMPTGSCPFHHRIAWQFYDPRDGDL